MSVRIYHGIVVEDVVCCDEVMEEGEVDHNEASDASDQAVKFGEE